MNIFGAFGDFKRPISGHICVSLDIFIIYLCINISFLENLICCVFLFLFLSFDNNF